MERPIVVLNTPPTSQTDRSAVFPKTGKPKRPLPGAPASGGSTPPTSPGGTTLPTPSPGPVASPPLETPPSSPSEGAAGGDAGSSGSNSTPVAAPGDGGRTTAGIPPVQCPGAERTVTNASVVVSNGVATATFQIAPGCSGISVSLDTYKASSTPAAPFNTVSGSFNAGGPFTLSAAVPACGYEADLITGGVKLASANGGASCAHPPPPPPSPPPSPTAQPPSCDHGNGRGDEHDDGGRSPGGSDTGSGRDRGDSHHDHSGPAGASGHKGSP